jgi:hypothetical protein
LGERAGRSDRRLGRALRVTKSAVARSRAA